MGWLQNKLYCRNWGCVVTVFASWKSGKSSSEHFVDNLVATFINFVNSDLIQVVCYYRIE